jgi:hypothetical protein
MNLKPIAILAAAAAALFAGCTISFDPFPPAVPVPTTQPTTQPAPTSRPAPSALPAPAATRPATAPATRAATIAATFVTGLDGLATQAIVTSPAPATVHVSALNLLDQPMDWLDERYAWNFGDAPGSQLVIDPRSGQSVDLNTTLTGPVAAYAYERPGDYTMTLTRTLATGEIRTYSAHVTVPPAMRTVYYISSTGSDTNTGADSSKPLRTANAAVARLSDHTEFRFQRGGVYPLDREFPLKRHDILVDCYGDPAQPLPVIYRTAPSLATTSTTTKPTTTPATTTSAATQPNFDTPAPTAGLVFSFWPGQTFDVTVRHLRLDSPFAIACTAGGLAYHAPVATFGILRGRNVTISDCEFVNLTEGPHGDSQLCGAMLLRNRQVDPLGIPARTLWLEGSDVVAIGNVATNSTNESPIRAANSGIVRGLVAFNDTSQLLDPAHDRALAKAAITLRTMQDVYVYGNRATDAEFCFDPLTAAAQDARVAGEGNVIRNGLLHLRTNVRHAVFRDNAIERDGGPCIAVTPGDGVNAWLEDIRIERNRGQGWLPNGRMFMVDAHADAAMRNCVLDEASNVYTKIAPPPATGPSH